ncbi:NAD kinase [Bathymodiolus heckerae thiotrophic gill symbiont]|uniref:NAD(+)/NADH kinase n=1 Tax=Bathymodiolus heckerae thiotrophic gill symbiont TaxID=1052212 RepID=UPI0010B1AFB0|nr:NAD(+)/NADH kinase [Bathymodiolus heckerae thiotrophic gill symbiont]SMN13303.1 NAD kinase [Bathymodiolus heckerae thiotrophic gill symbiont]
MFNTIGIITKPNDSHSDDKAVELSTLLKKRGMGVVSGEEQIAKQADLIIVVGGDGSLLNTARTFVDYQIPILGINLGRLGFLADVPATNMLDVVTEILNGNFTKEERHLLSCQIEQDGKILGQFLALNDVVVHRTETLKMIEFDLLIDGKFVNNQRADGVIITTPTGSTAYALSSGGPIIHPGIDVIGLVSICPHTMSHRPLLVPGESEVVVCIKESDEGASVNFDGQSTVAISAGQDIRLRQYSRVIQLLHPKNYDYFEIIRSKLHWGAKL